MQKLIFSQNFQKVCVLKRKHECSENLVYTKTERWRQLQEQLSFRSWSSRSCVAWTIVPSRSYLCRKFIQPWSIKVVYWRENFLVLFVSWRKTKNFLNFRVNIQLLFIQRDEVSLHSCFRCNTQKLCIESKMLKEFSFSSTYENCQKNF